jgi:predicted nuclease of predicted toxin-antitoxin system
VKLLLDENLSPAHAFRLRQAGHDAIAALDVRLGGADDTAVRRFAIEHGRVLVTLDGDFSNIMRFPPDGTPGVIWLRPWPPSEAVIETLMEGTLHQLAEIEMTGKLVVAETGRIRIR